MVARNVSYWDGSGFFAMRDGLDNRVLDLQAYAGEIYAAGDFVTDGGFTFFNHMARWNGDAWNPVGGGMSGGYWPVVNALDVHDGLLIAGGQFLEAGGVSAPHIASWDGQTWAPVGEGTDGWIHALGALDGRLVAGGLFTLAGEQEAARVAQWDGAAWSGFGDGVQDWVRAVAVLGNSLYVGGSFQMAGGNTSYYLARWDPAGNSAAPEIADLVRSRLYLANGNPAARRIELVYTLKGPAKVSLDLFDLAGRRVANLYRGYSPAGEHSVRADRSDLGGPSPGVYFVRLQAASERQTVKLLWVE